MKIVLSSLPPQVTEERIKDALEKFFPVRTVELFREGSDQAVTATVEVTADRMSAEQVTSRIHGLIIDGHPISATVPVFFQNRR